MLNFEFVLCRVEGGGVGSDLQASNGRSRIFAERIGSFPCETRFFLGTARWESAGFKKRYEVPFAVLSRPARSLDNKMLLCLGTCRTSFFLCLRYFALFFLGGGGGLGNTIVCVL